MSGVFQNIPSPPGEWGGGEDTLTRGRGGGVNILEDARHSSVLYICKYFVVSGMPGDIEASVWV